MLVHVRDLPPGTKFFDKDPEDNQPWIIGDTHTGGGNVYAYRRRHGLFESKMVWGPYVHVMGPLPIVDDL